MRLKGTRVQHIEHTIQPYSLPSAFFLLSFWLFIKKFYHNFSHSNYLFFPSLYFTGDLFLSIFIQIPRISLPSSLILISNLWLSILSFHLQSFISSFLRFRIISSYVYCEPFHVSCRLYIKKAAWGPLHKGRAFYTFVVSPNTPRTWTS
jgi:hypothetical protein